MGKNAAAAEEGIPRDGLLLIGGGNEQVPAIRLAAALGLKIFVTDGNPSAPGFAYADDHRVASTYDARATIKAARAFRRAHGLAGVMTIASDVPLTVAKVAEALKLPGIGVEAARMASDKVAMKRALQAAGVPIPRFEELESAAGLKRFARKGGAWIIKPADSRGSRGVLRLGKGVDLKWAFDHARSFSPTKRVLIEEYLPGPQISSESVVWDGRIWTPGLSDRNYDMLDAVFPHIVENGGQLPSLAAEGREAEIDRVLLSAAGALGIRRGNIKGDLVATPRGVRVIEIAARLSGGYLATHEVPLSTGVPLVEESMRMALGLRPRAENLLPRISRGVAIRYFFPPPGKLLGVSGAEGLAKRAWIAHWGIYVKPGELIARVTDHTKRAGFVIASGKDRAQAVARAERAIRMVRFKVSPS